MTSLWVRSSSLLPTLCCLRGMMLPFFRRSCRSASRLCLAACRVWFESGLVGALDSGESMSMLFDDWDASIVLWVAEFPRRGIYRWIGPLSLAQQHQHADITYHGWNSINYSIIHLLAVVCQQIPVLPPFYRIRSRTIACENLLHNFLNFWVSKRFLVHKSQGSHFQIIILILCNHCEPNGPESSAKTRRETVCVRDAALRRKCGCTWIKSCFLHTRKCLDLLNCRVETSDYCCRAMP